MRISHSWDPAVGSSGTLFMINCENLDEVHELMDRLYREQDSIPHDCPTPTLDDHVCALINASTQLTSAQRIRLHSIAAVCNDAKLDSPAAQREIRQQGTPGATQWNG